MTLFYKRAISDMLDHKFLNTITIITIAISILIVSAFVLFLKNVNHVMYDWQKGIRVMAYLQPNTPEPLVAEIKLKIKSMHSVKDVRFISKHEALNLIKKQMNRQSSLFENLKENPLPDAFEILMITSSQSQDKIEALATRLESLPQIEEVEYGQKWIGRFIGFFNLFKFVGCTMGGLFFIAAALIVANTNRLVLYSRREEIEIMRLVGATSRFIKAPFYLEGLVQGAVGGFFGLAALFIAFVFISSNVEQSLSSGFFTIQFLSIGTFFGIILCSAFLGWLGCYISLKQFLQY